MNKHTGGVWLKRKVDLGRAGSGFAIDFNEDQEQVVDYVYAEGDADVICEAGNIYNKTGLTPNQVLEQRDELLGALEAAVTHHDDFFKSSTGHAELPWVAPARAAIAKAKGETK